MYNYRVNVRSARSPMCFGARGALPFFDGHYHVFRFDVDSGVIHRISFFKFFRHLVDCVEMFLVQHVLVPHLKSKKVLVLIILVIVFKHNIKI
jgi:hypothetical protein